MRRAKRSVRHGSLVTYFLPSSASMMRACEPPRTWEICATAFRDTLPPPYVCRGVIRYGRHFWLCSTSEGHTYPCALAFVVAVVVIRLRGVGRNRRALRGRRQRFAGF